VSNVVHLLSELVQPCRHDLHIKHVRRVAFKVGDEFGLYSRPCR
jgi:hypothetical protein